MVAEPEEEAPLVAPWHAGKVTAGGFHTCAIRDDGEVYCWGGNRHGQLGVGSDLVDSGRPLQVRKAMGITSVVAGFEHTCGTFLGGSVKCWGLNTSGQLGDGSKTDRSELVEVKGLEGEVISLALGDGHSCALLSSGTVQCWGDNSDGQLGNSAATARTTAVRVAGLEKVTQLAAGAKHTCALSAKHVLCWGKNTSGELGQGRGSAREYLPKRAHLPEPTAAIAAGSAHSCAIGASGVPRCWGRNTFGQVGNGATANAFVPSQVRLAGVIALELGSAHSCAQLAHGQVYYWGSNELGQFGDGSTTNRVTPTQLPETFFDARAMAAGTVHGCGEFETGVLKCWGANDDGALGNGAKSAEPLLDPEPLEDFSLLD